MLLSQSLLSCLSSYISGCGYILFWFLSLWHVRYSTSKTLFFFLRSLFFCLNNWLNSAKRRWALSSVLQNKTNQNIFLRGQEIHLVDYLCSNCSPTFLCYSWILVQLFVKGENIFLGLCIFNLSFEFHLSKIVLLTPNTWQPCK